MFLFGVLFPPGNFRARRVCVREGRTDGRNWMDGRMAPERVHSELVHAHTWHTDPDIGEPMSGTNGDG